MDEQERHERRVRDLEDRLRTLEVVLWGPDGRNGMRSEMRGITAGLKSLEDKMDTRFDQIQVTDNTELSENFKTFKNTVLVVSVALLTGTFAIVAAVVSGVIH